MDWCWSTEAEPHLNGRSLRYPRGKAVGGCSVINGMIHMRGQVYHLCDCCGVVGILYFIFFFFSPQFQSRDFDNWAEILGDASWKYESVLPLFKKHERHWAGASDVHGGDGEWIVSQQRLRWEILVARFWEFATSLSQAVVGCFRRCLRESRHSSRFRFQFWKQYWSGSV